MVNRVFIQTFQLFAQRLADDVVGATDVAVRTGLAQAPDPALACAVRIQEILLQQQYLSFHYRNLQQYLHAVLCYTYENKNMPELRCKKNTPLGITNRVFNCTVQANLHFG